MNVEYTIRLMPDTCPAAPGEIEYGYSDQSEIDLKMRLLLDATALLHGLSDMKDYLRQLCKYGLPHGGDDLPQDRDDLLQEIFEKIQSRFFEILSDQAIDLERYGY